MICLMLFLNDTGMEVYMCPATGMLSLVVFSGIEILKLNIFVLTQSFGCFCLGGGHLHSEVGGPDLHLTLLPASEEE